jgi:hypothetical protein
MKYPAANKTAATPKPEPIAAPAILLVSLDDEGIALVGEGEDVDVRRRGLVREGEDRCGREGAD